jgi:hypothetical protein
VIGRRWWQHRDGGISPNPGWGDAAGWTEVQVVPLDAIVIERADLPAVTVGRLGLSVGGDEGGWDANADPEQWHANALQALALREYIREHPPVVPDVEVLAREVQLLGGFSYGESKSIAQRLLATGRVQVTP